MKKQASKSRTGASGSPSPLNSSKSSKSFGAWGLADGPGRRFLRRTAYAAVFVVLFSLALSFLLPAVTNSVRPLSEYGEKALFTAFGGRSPRTLDPQRSYSTDETAYTYSIYEPLYQYAYLKRPYELEPLAAEAVAKPRYLDKNGKTLPADAAPETIAESVYEIRIKPGIRFAPHPAFARDAEGKLVYADLDRTLDPKLAAAIKCPLDFPQKGTRTLTARDYAYAIRRMASPLVVSPIFGTMKTHIVGFAEYGEKLLARYRALTERSDENENIGPAALDLWADALPGVEVVDELTLRIRVIGKYPQFSYWLAMAFFAPVPEEAVRFYDAKLLREKNISLDTWPVGTGPFMMSVFEENRRHELRRNPNFHGEGYPCAGEAGDERKGLLADCGKPLPMVDRIVFDIEKEAVPLQTKFLQGYYDSPFIDRVDTGLGYLVAMEDDPDKAALYGEKALQFPKTVQAGFWYLGFNWLDPVVGGGRTPEEARRNRLLRQALTIAVDWEENLAIFQKNQGTPASGPVPPGLFGWRDDGPEAFNPIAYEMREIDGVKRAVRRSIEEAKKLLAEAGYPDGRDAKTGEPLILVFDYQQAAQGSKAYLEWYQRQFEKLGIQLEIRATDYNRFQEKMQKGAAQIFFWGWNADYPDAENFLFLFYGPNGKVKYGGENAGNYESEAFDKAFRAMRYLEDGPQKQALIDEMTRILQTDAPVIFGYYPPGAAAYQSWVGNVKPSGLVQNGLKYLKVDAELRLQKIVEWNKPVLWPLALLLFGMAVLAAGGRFILERRYEARAIEPKAVDTSSNAARHEETES